MKRLLALALLLVALPCAAQSWSAGVFGTIANLSELGYGNGPYNASWIGGVNTEYDDKEWRGTLSGDYSPANKGTTENDWSTAWDLQVMKKIGPYAMIRGGVTYSYTFTHLYDKQAWRGTAGFGLQTPEHARYGQLRFYADHIFPGSDSSNGLEGERYTLILRPPLHLGKVWFYASGSYGYYRFHASNSADSPRLVAHVYSETVGAEVRF